MKSSAIVRRIARTVFKTCLNVRSRERVLIVTDSGMMQIAELLFKAAKLVADDVELVTMKPTGRDGKEPPAAVARAMRTADVVLMPTSYSLSHTKARIAACKAGSRIASMPRVPMLSFTKGGLTADYQVVNKLCKRMLKAVKRTKRMLLTAPNGTSISFSVAGRKWVDDEGYIHEAGHWGNLPAGEVATAPVVGSANGKIVFDYFGEFGRGVWVVVKKGYVVKTNSAKLRNVFKKLGRHARNIAEIGIGANPKACIIGNILEDEKVYGTVHMALGNNSAIGGRIRVPLHVDGIIEKPTLIADGKILIKDGEWRI